MEKAKVKIVKRRGVNSKEAKRREKQRGEEK
jgi:hypothetical protein